MRIVLCPPSRDLNSAALGLDLGEVVARALSQERPVCVDLSHVIRMTPSYSNAFIMTILERVPRPVIQQSLQIENASELVVQSINKAIDRYDRGIRLTNQRPKSA